MTTETEFDPDAQQPLDPESDDGLATWNVWDAALRAGADAVDAAATRLTGGADELDAARRAGLHYRDVRHRLEGVEDVFGPTPAVETASNAVAEGAAQVERADDPVLCRADGQLDETGGSGRGGRVVRGVGAVLGAVRVTAEPAPARDALLGEHCGQGAHRRALRLRQQRVGAVAAGGCRRCPA